MILSDDLFATHDDAAADKAVETWRAYRSRFDAFKAYVSRTVSHHSGTAAIVAAFVSSEARRGISASTIARRVTSTRYAHLLDVHTTPIDSEAVKTVVRGIRHVIGSAPAKKTPATADMIAKMLETCPATLRGRRDVALLSLGFAGAFRRSKLVALQLSGLAESPDGFRITIRHSKTDQESSDQTIAIPRGSRLHPVDAVRTWLAAAEIETGPVFRPINRGGRVVSARLTAESAASIIKNAASAQASTQPHSLATA